VLGVLASADYGFDPERQMREFSETKTFLDNILQSSTKYSIIGMDLDHHILSWNKGASHNYGYAAREVIGQDSAILHTPQDVESGAVDRLRTTADKDGLAEGTFERVRKDGSRFTASVVVTRRDDALGHPVGFLVMSHDISEKEQAEQQLRSTAMYSRSLIEASPDPLVTISPAGKITDVNEAAIRVTGVARAQLVGTDFSDYFTEPDRAREGYRQVFAQGFVTDYPLTIRPTSGDPIEVLYTAPVNKDTTSNVLGVLAAAGGGGASERQMREFSETKAFLDNILQSSTKYSIIGMDLDHHILSWNKGASRNYGYAAPEVIGKDSTILHAPQDVESGAVDRLRTTAAEDGLAEGTFERVRKDGSRFTASVVVTRRDDALGHPVGFLLMSHDISDKELAERQLRSTARYSRSLIEASLDPQVTISPAGKITDVNEAASRLTGVARTQLVGTDFSDYFTEPDRAREGYRQVFAQGIVTDYPLTIRHTGGGLTNVLYNASVYNDEAGRVLGAFVAARDVTAQRRAESEVAKQRARELERLAELERFQKLTVGRELRMIELKKEIEDLRAAAGGN